MHPRYSLIIPAYNEERLLGRLLDSIDLARAATSHVANIRVEGFTGLMVEYARSIGASVVVRGLRAGSFVASISCCKVRPSVEAASPSAGWAGKNRQPEAVLGS